LKDQILKLQSFEKIVTKWKKPFNSEELTKILSEKTEYLFRWNETCIIGDWIFTDITLGKINGALTIMVEDFEDSEVTNDIKILR